MVSDIHMLYYFAFYGMKHQFVKLYTKLTNGPIDSMVSTLIYVYDESHLEMCVARGCSVNLDFAQWIFFQNEERLDINQESGKIKTSIANRYIMSNCLNEKDAEVVLEECTPFCIWYPEYPTKKTCEKLLKTYGERMKYQIAMLCVLKNWTDLYLKLNVKSEVHLYSLSKLLNRSEILKHQKRVEPENDMHYELLRFNSETVLKDSPFSPYIYEKLNFKFLFCKGTEYSLIHVGPLEELDLLDDGSKLSHQRFELTYLQKLLEEPSSDNQIMIPKSGKKIDIDRIYRDTPYALAVFKLEPTLYGRYCTERFINVGYVNSMMVSLYHPMNWAYEYFRNSYGYEKLLEEFGDYKYPIGLNIIKAHKNDIYSKHDYLPDVDLCFTARKCLNEEVYKDQVSKAQKIQLFFRHVDITNGCLFHPPRLIPFKEVDLTSPVEFDYDFILGINKTVPSSLIGGGDSRTRKLVPDIDNCSQNQAESCKK